MPTMRIALVSPYSWTYPGGVTRHIEALADQFAAGGHDVRVLAPFDPDDRLSARLHRGARPEPRPAPDYLIPLGRTIGYPMNGAVSNLAGTPTAVVRLRRALEQGRFDVVHVHEPVAPAIGWDAVYSTRAPLVGTFHCYSENRVSNNIANLIGARQNLNHLQRADRRLGGRRVDRPALLRRALPDHPQRRRPRRRARRARPRAAPRRRAAAAAHRIRRPGGRAQGPARAAARLRGAARAHPGGADDHRRRGRGHRPGRPRRRRHLRVGQGLRRAEVGRAARRRRALRALAGRRVLRHGAHRGVRGRHAGRGVGHRGLPRRGPRRPGRRARAPRRRDRARRGAARSLARAAPARRAGAGRRGERRALRLAARRRRRAERLRGRRRGARARDPGRAAPPCAPGSCPPTCFPSSPRAGCRRSSPRPQEHAGPPSRLRAARPSCSPRWRARCWVCLRSNGSASTASDAR